MWLYKNKQVRSLEDLPKDSFGFVYEISHNKTGRKYIGKKSLYNRRNKTIGKRELALLKEERKMNGIGGRLPTKKLVVGRQVLREKFFILRRTRSI
jgi:hypothetical protein